MLLSSGNPIKCHEEVLSLQPIIPLKRFDISPLMSGGCSEALDAFRLFFKHLRHAGQHTHFIPIVGVGKRGAYYLVHGDLPRKHSFGTTLRFSGPVPADSRQ